ncbi:MAG: M16 family metallopeptidase, partial [Candidatus Methylomirabilales bacterium]
MRTPPLIVGLLCLLLSPVAGLAKDPSPLEVRFHPFSNGVGLYHVRLEEAVNFMLSVTVWVGSVNEDPKRNGGVSHLLEHILFHQPDVSESEFNAQVESQGGTFNAMTAEDFTEYYVRLPARHLELGQNWLHKVLFHDRLVTDRLEEEKEIVNRENEWSIPTWWDWLWDLIDPDYLELPGFWQRNFRMHEYDQLPEGKYEVASTLNAAQLEAHYRTYYYPENMVLLYVGPHELEEVVTALGPTFGSVPPTGRQAKPSPLVDNVSPRPYFSTQLPMFFSDPEYHIRLGYLFTGLRFSERSEIILYRFVLRQLLEERFRYAEGKTYSVGGSLHSYRGAGYLRFRLEAGPETYWTQLKEVKKFVWGDPGEYLSQKDYERYKMTLLEKVMARRELWAVHERIWDAIHWHPLHRPSPEETDLYGPLRSLSYPDFLQRIRSWQGRTAPLVKLSMPVFPFSYAHLVLFAFAVGIGVKLGGSLLRRPFPRENIMLITSIPYGIPGSIHLAVLYAVAVSLYLHLTWAISYGTLFFNRFSALASVEPYLDWTLNGILLGIAVGMGGSIMPRKVLVTDTALVLKMRSPLFLRIPLQEIAGVEPVDGWAAWRSILRLQALPIYPWFLRGLLIRRRSGRSLVLHTRDDIELRKLLTSRLSNPLDGARGRPLD